MSCPPVGHGPRKGPNRKVQNYFTIEDILLILLITSGFGGFFRFDPRQEVQTLPPVSAGGFVLSLAKLTMRLVSLRSLTLLGLSHSSYKQLFNLTNLVLWLEEESKTKTASMPSML
jgi:hypothetical protein